MEGMLTTPNVRPLIRRPPPRMPVGVDMNVDDGRDHYHGCDHRGHTHQKE